ncbi:MAG TPA: prephenate dehydratase [Rhizomicrobium sp.]|jgi:prephenate dehydratase|nr:prephenate dehydratase [Rhizomicrobium sp.]
MSKLIARAKTVAFQGELGAFGNQAAREALPHCTATPKPSFEDAVEAVRSSETDLCIIPVENSLHGRIADIHHLLPQAGLYIVGEYFLPIHLQLLGLKGAKIGDIKVAYSQPPALGQCRKIVRELGIKTQDWYDTAGSALHVSKEGDKSLAAIASKLAGEMYGLDVLRADVEDEHHNTTRFLIMAHERDDAPAPKPGDTGKVVTSFVFRVRNVPAALYKAMGGFATNGINMTKLESYQLGGTFNATQFYADIEGHPEEQGVKHAMEELAFFCSELRVLGAYPAHAFREDLP